ncbi:hypothetical protein QE152_g36235 [Popillia japonica]|uniref:Uncharacterized protein n=1 Tax=Popillia japonica TaxID=7064 RepID=A0AAW1IDM9_POPJA
MISRYFSRPTASTYSFVSECLYVGHKAFDLAYRVVVDNLIKLNEEMVRIERTYNDAISRRQGKDGNGYAKICFSKSGVGESLIERRNAQFYIEYRDLDESGGDK